MLESIVEIIQELERKYLHLTLKFTPGLGNKRPVSPATCYALLEDYFIHCQIAEARIKEEWKKGILCYEEVQGLYKELGRDVTSIITISKSNLSINDKMIKLTETQPFIPRLLQAFTRPDVYEAFVHINRRYRARAEPTLQRMGTEKLR
jgi:hypothetical protein